MVDESGILIVDDKPSSPEVAPVVLTTPSQGTMRDKSLYLTEIVIKDKIGKGNFGEVYRAVWRNTTTVAAKKLQKVEKTEEFEKEASLMRNLNHVGIVRFFGLYESGEETYIIMEFIKQGSLKGFLAKREDELTKDQLFSICVSIASGMDYLESMKVLHGDLRADNILITESEGQLQAKLADFGLSKEIHAESIYTVDKTSQFPVRWAAPETFKHGKYSIKSEVWAFGIVMWEIFEFGSSPYPGFDNAEVLDKVNRGWRLPCPKNCPTKVHDLMLQCWKEKSAERPTFKEIFFTLESVAEEPTEPKTKKEGLTNSAHTYELAPITDETRYSNKGGKLETSLDDATGTPYATSPPQIQVQENPSYIIIPEESKK